MPAEFTTAPVPGVTSHVPEGSVRLNTGINIADGSQLMLFQDRLIVSVFKSNLWFEKGEVILTLQDATAGFWEGALLVPGLIVGWTAVVVQLRFFNIAFVAGPTYPVEETPLSL